MTEAQTFFVASPSGKLTCLLGPPPSSSSLPLLSADLLYSSCDHIFRTKNEDRTCLINTNYGAMQQNRRKRMHTRKYGTSGRGHGAHTTSLSSPPRRVLTAGMTCRVPLLPPVGWWRSLPGSLTLTETRTNMGTRAKSEYSPWGAQRRPAPHAELCTSQYFLEGFGDSSASLTHWSLGFLHIACWVQGAVGRLYVRQRKAEGWHSGLTSHTLLRSCFPRVDVEFLSG